MPKQSGSAPTSTEGLADRVVSGPRIPEGLGGDNVNGGMAMNDPRAFTTPTRTETTIDKDGNIVERQVERQLDETEQRLMESRNPPITDGPRLSPEGSYLPAKYKSRQTITRADGTQVTHESIRVDR